MHLIDDDNNIIDAECGLDLDEDELCVVIESSSGANLARGIQARNPEYNRLVATLLTRLRQLKVHLTRIVLDSDTVARLPLQTKIAELPYAYPVDLASVDIETFRKALGRTIAAMHRKPNARSSGNGQKKIRICIDRQISADELITADANAAANDSVASQEGPPGMTETERLQLRAARLGQGKFRSDLLARFGGRCAAAGISNTELLIASHIKPWKACLNRERLDPDNGILLSALWDRLFDRGLITFSDDGTLISSPLLSPQDHRLCGLHSARTVAFPSGAGKYLAYHRAVQFRKD